MTGATVGTTDTVGDCRGRLFALLMGGAALSFVVEAALQIVFMDSWVDELVFVAGGHGFVTGKFVLYTGDFQTNYPPVGFLVSGLVQAFAGPSFYVGRVFSAAVAAAGLALAAYTAARLRGRWAAVITVWLTVSTGFIMRYLVSATPYSLVLLFVMPAVTDQVSRLPAIWKESLSGAFMSLAMMTRQDRVVLFVLLLLYLVWVHRSGRAALAAGLSGLVVAGLIATPFLPEMLRVFVVTPGWNLLGNELLVQPPSWTKASRAQALLDYLRTYRWLLFLLVAASPAAFLTAWRQARAANPDPSEPWEKKGKPSQPGAQAYATQDALGDGSGAGADRPADRRATVLLWGLFVTSFLLHIWPPTFCPYCVLNYGVYYWPLGAILIGVTVAAVVVRSGGMARAFALSAVATVVAFSLGSSIGVHRRQAWGNAPLEAMRQLVLHLQEKRA